MIQIYPVRKPCENANFSEDQFLWTDNWNEREVCSSRCQSEVSANTLFIQP